MRASRILAARPERAIVALAQLCEERVEEPLPTPDPPSIFIPPRLSSIPPQTPYTVGSSESKGLPSPEKLSPATKPGDSAIRIQDPNKPQLEHMAPKRSEWTSPPPPEASSADHTSFENKLGLGLELATSSTEARERQESCTSSSSTNSEVFSDEEPRSDTDDVRSVHSFTEGASPSAPAFHRPSWHLHGSDSSSRNSPSPRSIVTELPGNVNQRGRFVRPADIEQDPRNIVMLGQPQSTLATAFRSEASRRSISGPPRAFNRLSWPSMVPTAIGIPLPSSPSHSGSSSPVKAHAHPQDVSTIYYETGSRQSPVLYSTSPGQGRQSPIFPYQQRQYHMALAGSGPPSATPSRNSYRAEPSHNHQPRSPITPTTTPGPSYNPRPTHHHTQSNATITAPSPRAHPSQFIQNYKSNSSSSSPSQSRSQSRSPLSSINVIPPGHRHQFTDSPHSPLASASTGSGSPTPSSTGYATSVSASPPSSSSDEDLAKSKYQKMPKPNIHATNNAFLNTELGKRIAPVKYSQNGTS